MMSSKKVCSKPISNSVVWRIEKIPNLANDKLKERLLLPRMVNFSVIAIHRNKATTFVIFSSVKKFLHIIYNKIISIHCFILKALKLPKDLTEIFVLFMNVLGN